MRAAAGVAALLLLAGACSSDGDDDAAGTDASTATGDGSGASTTAGGGASPAGWDQVVADGEAEGKVTVYSSLRPQVGDVLTQACSDQYPSVTFELLQLPSSQMVPRVDQELSSGTLAADALITTVVTWNEDHSAAGDFLPLVAGPSLSADAWVDNPFNFGDYVRIHGEPLVITYNTDLVDTPPAEYEDLLDPMYRGRLGTVVPDTPNTTTWYHLLEDELGTDFLEDLGAQEPIIGDSGTPLTQQVAAGETMAATWAITSNVEPIMESGAPVDFVVPTTAETTYVFDLAIFKDAEHPNAAQLFADCATSEATQQAINGDGYSIAPIDGIDGVLGPPELLANVLADDLTEAETADLRQRLDGYLR